MTSQSWYNKPLMPEHALADQAQAMRAVIRVISISVGLLVPLAVVAQPEILPRGIFVLTVVWGSGIISAALVRRGRIRAAAILFVSAIVAMLAINAIYANGIRSPGMQAMFLFPMLGGLLLGEREGVILAIVAATIGFVFAFVEAAGLLPPPLYEFGPVALWILQALYITLALMVMRLATGSVKRALSVARDELAVRKEAEARLEERVKELRLLHDVAALLQSSPIADPAVLREIVSRMPSAMLHSEDAEARITYRDQTVATPGWVETPWRLAATFSTSDGSGTVEFAYRTSHTTEGADPFLPEERELIASVAEMLRARIEQEITETRRHSFEAQLRQTQKMEAIGTLAGGIAHDFNNILTLIGANAQLIQAKLPADDPMAESMTDIMLAHGRARDLVKRILLFSRRQEATRAKADIGSVVEEVMQLLRAGTPHNVDIRVNILREVPPVLADTSQLHQVLMNLGTNAIYAMKDAGGVLSVTLDVITVSDVVAGPSAELYPGVHVRVSVRDTGVGMTPPVRERLFEPFFTTKGDAGTGLGLSVVHGIIKEHSGAITVDSTPGAGTEFCIYLPVASENAEVRRTGLLEVIRGAGQHIMLVDDEASIVAVMSRTLRILDYRVTGFTDPVAALRAFSDNPAAFDAVITDYSMPVMSGEDLVVAMRGIRANIPAAITSGSTLRQALNIARTGAVSWISKPASLGELSQVVNEMLTGVVVPGGEGKSAGASVASAIETA